MNNEDDFDWEAYEKAVREAPLYPAEQCYRLIEEVIDDSIIRLYDSIDNFIFQDILYLASLSIIMIYGERLQQCRID